MEDHEEELHAGGGAHGAAHALSPAAHGSSSPLLTGAASKNGLQLLYNLLAIAYHVLEETKHVNLKPPLQPSSKLFTIDAPAPSSPPRSPGPPDSPQEDGSGAQEANGGAVGAAHALHAGATAGHPIVIPYSPEEIQDSFTKVATLKNQYIKMSNDLLAIVKQLEAKTEQSSPADKVSGLLTRRLGRVSSLTLGFSCYVGNRNTSRSSSSGATSSEEYVPPVVAHGRV